jgi:hypothetical protein
MSQFKCRHGVIYPATCHHCVEHVTAHNNASIEALAGVADPAALVASHAEMLAALRCAWHHECEDAHRSPPCESCGLRERARRAKGETP